MGDPKKLRKKYETPIHPWNSAVIEEERELRKEFGLGKKKEILIARSFLKKYKNIAKRLISNQTAQGDKEKAQVMDKLQRLGLLTAGALLDDVLNLGVTDLLNRRLQSVVYRKGLARSMKQARQFITHRHIRVGEKEITSPGYIVSLEEESALVFKSNSALADEEHPERAIEQKEVQKEKEAISEVKSEEVAEATVETPKEEEQAPESTEEAAPESEETEDKGAEPESTEEATTDDTNTEDKNEENTE